MATLDPRTWFRPEVKASAAGTAISGFGAGKPVWTERNYTDLARASYVKNPIGFRCVAMIAQAVAEVTFLLNSGDGKEIENHPVLDLLMRPSPGKTQSYLMESAATYLQLSGNAYIEAVGPSRLNAPPRELWSLRPDRMKVIAGKQGLPSGYLYTANGKDITWPVDPITGYSDILHLQRFNPIDDWYGMSPVEPAAYAVDRHNEAGAHNMAVLQNGATPSGAMIFKPVVQDGVQTSAPAEIIKKAEERLNRRYSGSENAGRPMVLGGNVDWVSFGMTMEQLQLTESKLDAAQDICAAFGVPIELLLPGQSTYNNKREAKLAFYEETVLPMVGQIVDQMNIWLTPRFGEGLILRPNMDEIEALSLRREIRQKNTKELWESGLISRDEGREALQFEPEPDMPQHKIDGAVLSALVNAATKDTAMFLPLFNYMKSVGLTEKGQTLQDFMDATSALFEDETADVIAALTDQATL